MTRPSVIRLEEMHGADSVEKWRAYLEVIYEVFCSNVARARLTFQGLPIKCRYHEPYEGKHASFWHLMSEGLVEAERTPDLERCARIPWIAWVIQNANDPKLVRWWETERATSHGRKTRIPLWLFGDDYAVILEKRPQFYLLITTYCLRSHQKAKFAKEWTAWQAGKSRGRV